MSICIFDWFCGRFMCSLACVRLCAFIILLFSYQHWWPAYNPRALCTVCTVHTVRMHLLHCPRTTNSTTNNYLNTPYTYSLSMKNKIKMWTNFCVCFFCFFLAHFHSMNSFLFYIFNFYLKYNVYWHNLTFKN